MTNMESIMSTTVEQLLSKAMSTSSEDEAISCLVMARKKSSSFNKIEAKDNLYKGGSAEYWHNKTYEYYGYAQKYKSEYESSRKSLIEVRSKLAFHKYFTMPVIIGMSFILCTTLILL